MNCLKIIFIGILTTITLVSTAQDYENTFREIVKGENASFWGLEFEKWTTFYAHTPYVYFSMSTGADKNFRSIGWEELSRDFKKDFEIRSKKAKSTAIFTFEDFHIKVKGDMAWVVCTELSNGKPLFLQHRVLEKIEGDWKTIALHLVNISKSHRN